MKAEGRWEGIVKYINGRSYLADFFQKIPLNSLNFEGVDGELMVYLMASCPGIFNGDHQQISAQVKENAHLFLTDSSPTELHPSGTTEPMIQQTTFTMEKNSILEYMPETIIPFKNANYKGQTTLYMNKGSQAFVSEIIAAGRVGRNELYEYKGIETRFDVYWDGLLSVCDVIRLDPLNDLTSKGVLDDFTHYGTLWVLSESVTSGHLQHIRQHILSDLEEWKVYGGGSTLNVNGLVFRLLGHSSETIQAVIQRIWGYLRKELISLNPMEILK